MPNKIYLYLIICCFQYLSGQIIFYVPDDYSTIQAAIDASLSGDTVLVAAGTYTENIDFNGKNIVVQGEDRETTIIDGSNNTLQNGGSVACFVSGETNDAKLENFTLSGGTGYRWGNEPGWDATHHFGGGIYCSNSQPTLINLRLFNNNVSVSGGGIRINQANPIMENIIIDQNYARYSGGGIACSGSSITMTNITVENNSVDSGDPGMIGDGGGINIENSINVNLENIIIRNNSTSYRGGGLNIINSEINLINSVITNNIDTYSPNAQVLIDVYPDIDNDNLYTQAFHNCTITDNIYINNAYNSASLIIINSIIPNSIIDNSGSTDINISYSIVDAIWEGTGNIDADPFFTNPDNGDYTLVDYSSAIGAGTSDGTPSTDIEGNPRPNPAGSNPDMGAYENTRSVPQLHTVDDYIIINEDTDSTIWVASNDHNINWEEDNLNILEGPISGTAVVVDDSLITYSPTQDYFGTDTIHYVITDGTESDNSAIYINVMPVNDLPVVTPQEISFLEDDTLSITLSGEDIEDHALIFTIIDQPTHGILLDNSTETVSVTFDGNDSDVSIMKNLYYIPDSNYYGSDSFTFAAYDEYSYADTSTQEVLRYGESETISLTIASVNDAPRATTPDVYALENTETEVFLTGEGGGGQLEADETLTYYLASLPSEGTVSVVSNGNPIENSQLPLVLPEPVLYLQYSNTFVSDSISYYIKDNGGTDNGGQDTSEQTTLPIYLQIVPIFEYQTEGPIEGGISKLDSVSTYVTASGDGIYRFDDDGNKLYKLDVAGEVKSVTTITPAHNIYIGSTDNNLYSFGSAGISNPNWPLALGSEATASVAVDLNENIYIGTHNGIFQALSSDKQILWSYNAGAAVYCSAAITVNNDLIFANENGMLYCFDLDEINTATPSPTWYYSIGEGVVSSIALDGNYIFATTLDGSLIKLEYDPSNSSPTELWSFQADTVITSSPIIGSQHEIYFGTQLGTVYSINSDDGAVIWSHNTGSSINSTGALAEYGSDLDRLFIGNDNGDVYALSITDGHPYWIYGSGFSIQSAFLYDDGIVYFGTEDGRVLKIADNEALSGELTRGNTESISIWGTFQGDNSRTGNQSTTSASLSNSPELLFPIEFALKHSYPNPFNPVTNIQYELPEITSLTLAIHDMTGREIATLYNGTQTPGYHSISWDASGYASGVYFVKMVAGSYVNTQKLMLVK
jgi:outer membrane protein assembly factor BamB